MYNASTPLISFNKILPPCWFRCRLGDGVRFKVTPDIDTAPDVIGQAIYDAVEATAAHFATIDLTVRASIHDAGSEVHHLEPFSFDETLETILEACTKCHERESVPGAMLTFHVKIRRPSKRRSEPRVSAMITGRDGLRDISKRNLERATARQLKDYLSRNTDWLIAAGVQEMTLRYSLQNCHNRYPDSERALMGLAREPEANKLCIALASCITDSNKP